MDNLAPSSTPAPASPTGRVLLSSVAANHGSRPTILVFVEIGDELYVPVAEKGINQGIIALPPSIFHIGCSVVPHVNESAGG